MVKRYSVRENPTVSNSFDESYLTMREVDECIAALEKRYGFSSAEFLNNQAKREALSEDEFLEWEACIEDRSELKHIEEENLRAYIDMIRRRVQRAARRQPPKRSHEEAEYSRHEECLAA